MCNGNRMRACRCICALADFKAPITFIMEITLQNEFKAYLTSRQNELSQVKCCTAVPTSNSSHYYLLLQAWSWLQVDFGMSVQSPRRSPRVTGFVMTLTHEEVNRFIHEMMLWIVRGHSETWLSFSLALCEWCFVKHFSMYIHICLYTN